MVLDEYTRESLTIEVERSMRAEAVRSTLEYLFAVRGTPQYLRSDNGLEFVAKTIQKWLKQSGVGTLYIAPGSPSENAYIESFNSRLRGELLGTEVFGNLRKAKVLVEDYRLRYNHHRPHSSLNCATSGVRRRLFGFGCGLVIGAKVAPSTAILEELQLGIRNSRAALPYISPSQLLSAFV